MKSALALVLVWLVAAPALADPRAYVVAVGNRDGMGEVSLHYSARDAARVAEVLVRLGGVAPERATVLVDASAADLAAALAAVADDARAAPADDDVTLFVYFSGHGAGDTLHLAGERLRVEDLRAWVEAVPATLRIVVLDACRTGGFARRKGFRPAEPFDIHLRTPGGPGGTVIVRSSSDGEAAHESDRLGGPSSRTSSRVRSRGPRTPTGTAGSPSPRPTVSRTTARSRPSREPVPYSTPPRTSASRVPARSS